MSKLRALLLLLVVAFSAPSFAAELKTASEGRTVLSTLGTHEVVP